MIRRTRLSGLPSALAAVVWGMFASPSGSFAQCAMCGSAAASSPGVARGLAYSIFFLLGMLALVVTWFVLLVLRSQARVRRAAAPPPPGPGATSIPAPVLQGAHAPVDP